MHGRAVRSVIVVLSTIALCSIAPHSPKIPAPGLVLWAWERPEDVRFVNPATTGIAYLAATVNLQQDGMPQYHFRQQPLRVPPAAALIAVVRIETPPRFVFPNPATLVPGIAAAVRERSVVALQIDYDARASERPFYRSLLAELRRRIDIPVGITALASWCDGDTWLSTEPISEAVPMFFRMGRNESHSMPVREPGCRTSIGLSTDEPWPAHRPSGLRNNSRIYVFNPHVWTESEYNAVVRQAEAWK